MNLTYTIEGEGSDVLLLHGFPSNMYFWDEIKKELIKNLDSLYAQVHFVARSAYFQKLITICIPIII